MTSSLGLVSKARGVFYGWWMVLGSAVLLTYHSGTWWYSFGVLFKPIAQEFGWSRAVTAGAFSITNLEGGFLGPVSGWAIDRFGPRVVLLVGLLLLALGYVSLSLIDSLVAFYATYALLIGIGAHASGLHTHVAVAARWFVKHRARAMGYVTVGAGLGGVVVTPVVAALVEAYGWRATARALAVGLLLVGLPVTALMRSGRPEGYGLRPDGANAEGAPAPLIDRPNSRAVSRSRDATVGEALQSRTFWLLVLAWGLSGASTTAVAVHLVPLFTDKGLSTTWAASGIQVLTLLTLPSRFIFPWFADRYDIRYAYAASFVFQACGLVVLLVAPDLIFLYLAVGLFGLGQGGNLPLRSATTAAYYGRERFATIQGWMSSFGSIGAMLGPIIAGGIFDATGSYALALLLLATACLLASATVLSAPRLAPIPTEASAPAQGERA